MCVGVIFTHFNTSFHKCCKHARIELFMLSCHKFIWPGPHIDGSECEGEDEGEGACKQWAEGQLTAEAETCCQTDVRQLSESARAMTDNRTRMSRGAYF